MKPLKRLLYVLPETSPNSTLFFNFHLSKLGSHSVSSTAENISVLTCDSDVAKQNNVLYRTHQICRGNKRVNSKERKCQLKVDFVTLQANSPSSLVFSLILRMTGKLNFQTGKAILLPVEFSRIPSNFKR